MVIVVFGFSALPAAGAAATGDLEALRQRALELVNKAREARGRSRLQTGPDLDKAAQSHAQDMLRRGYYSHESPEGAGVQDRYIAAGGGRSELVAENIARCDGCAPPATVETVEQLHQGWMNSPGHRENILREGLNRFGYGIVADARQGLYAVQIFAGAGTPRGAGDAPRAGLTADQIPARARQLINRARGEAKIGDLHASPALSEAARNLLPDPNADLATLNDPGNDPGNLFEALPADQRGQWRALSVVIGVCGGCGTEPTEADLEFFQRQWLENPRYQERLLDPSPTAMGFALQANGSGRKVALLVLGTSR